MSYQTKSDEWMEDCCKWWGHLLIGQYGHWCPDWDDLPIDESCSEFIGCNCFKAEKEKDDLRKFSDEIVRKYLLNRYPEGVKMEAPEVLDFEGELVKELEELGYPRDDILLEALAYCGWEDLVATYKRIGLEDDNC